MLIKCQNENPNIFTFTVIIVSLQFSSIVFPSLVYVLIGRVGTDWQT